MITEDDVLHIKQLPDFQDKAASLQTGLGQSDSELLLSFLTVPYLRIPLVLGLFASQDRIHSLQSVVLRRVLAAVLFEPGEYLPLPHLLAKPTPPHTAKAGKSKPKASKTSQKSRSRNGTSRRSMKRRKQAETLREDFKTGDLAPNLIPTPDKQLLATPYGLLYNELVRSPGTVLKPCLSLLKAAIALDSGDVRESTLPLILYLIAICARIDNYITIIIHNADNKTNTSSVSSSSSNPSSLRLSQPSAQGLSELKELWAQLRRLLRVDARGLLQKYLAQALRGRDGGDSSAKYQAKYTRLRDKLQKRMARPRRGTRDAAVTSPRQP